MLERDGSKTIELDGLRGVDRDHLWAYVDDDGEIVMEVDNYHPDPEESFDLEKWEEYKCYLGGPATRENWKIIFRIGRALVRKGKINLLQPGQAPMEIACDGHCVVTIN